jgi:hypothetical protein
MLMSRHNLHEFSSSARCRIFPDKVLRKIVYDNPSLFLEVIYENFNCDCTIFRDRELYYMYISPYMPTWTGFY